MERDGIKSKGLTKAYRISKHIPPSPHTPKIIQHMPTLHLDKSESKTTKEKSTQIEYTPSKNDGNSSQPVEKLNTHAQTS